MKFDHTSVQLFILACYRERKKKEDGGREKGRGGWREERGGKRGGRQKKERGGPIQMVYLILCWNINTVFSQRRVYSEYIANAGPLPLLEGLALSQLPGILSKSLQVIPLGGEHLGRGRGKWGGRESKEKGEKEEGGERRGGEEEKGERERERK